MPSQTIIYPDTVNFYQASGDKLTWSELRDGESTVVTGVVINPTAPRYFIADAGAGNYAFARTYMQFDLTVVTDPITSMRLYVNGISGFTTGETSYVAFGARKSLDNNSGDYNRYLSNLIGSSELSTIIVRPSQYSSCELDITTYPPDGGGGLAYYNIALVSDDDFLNNIGGLSGAVRINNSSAVPYLIVNPEGYANNVNGVAGTSIVTVSGINATDIVNIAGV